MDPTIVMFVFKIASREPFIHLDFVMVSVKYIMESPIKEILTSIKEIPNAYFQCRRPNILKYFLEVIKEFIIKVQVSSV